MSLEDYEPVAQRLDRWFTRETELGHIPRVITTMLSKPGDDVCVFRAELWRVLVLADGAGERGILLASGHAEEVRNSNHITKVSHLETTETSAIGRALANWNLAGSNHANRPSREEMAKVQRVTTSNPQANSSWKQTRDAKTIEQGEFKQEMEARLHRPMTGAASEKQIGYIKGACKRDGFPAPVWVDGLTKQQASDWIEQHKNGTPAQAINREMESDVVEAPEDPF